MDDMENNGNVHRRLVDSIEEKVNRNVVVYHANLGHPGGLLLDHEAELVDHTLATIDLDRYERKFDLVCTPRAGRLSRPPG